MIVLTGGAGFIGSCFLKKLNDEGINDIIIVDHLGSEDKWKNLVGKKFSRFINKEEFRYQLFDNVFEGSFDAIIHFGACSTTTEKNADYIFDNNLNYSIDLATYAIENDIRFIYASSAATYGNGENGYSDYKFDNLMPLNAYGLSKQLFDQWVVENNLDEVLTGIKFFNVFGPNEYHKGEMASMIYKSFLQIKNLGIVRLFKSNHKDYKDGEQKRDFIYVKDVVDIIWQMYQNDNISGIYNLGTGKARTWNDLVVAVFNAMGLKSRIEYVDMPENLVNQYQNFTQADMSKLNETIKNVKFRTLEQSIDDYVKNHLLKNWQYL